MLDKELQYYIENQSELVQKFQGKFLVIKNQAFIGIYNAEIEAYSETVGVPIRNILNSGMSARRRKLYPNIQNQSNFQMMNNPTLL